MPDTNYKKIIVSQGQSLIDIAMQEYGALPGVFLILEDNTELSAVDQTPIAGTEINIRVDVPEISEGNRAIARKFVKEGLRVNSGSAPDTELQRYFAPGYVATGYIEAE